jgi:starch-binding outer membrane protein, SusD/RagB family
MKLKLKIKIVSIFKILKSVVNRQLAISKDVIVRNARLSARLANCQLQIANWFLSIACCLLLIVLLGGCKKWIDVKPSDRLTEDQLYSTTKGYLNALNGIYVGMSDTSLYGDRMTVSALDVMGQYYLMNSTTYRYYDYATFDYTDDRVRTTFDNMWKKTYELIVNCNVIIERCGEDGNGVLANSYFGIVKGEALALRAMLHLDMLRLFGPIYTEADKDKPCIPYNTASRPRSSALLSSAAVMQNIINDLTAAATLLKDADPIITDGVRHSASPSGTNDLYYRQYRLNYYAVKALLARAYLWMQDKPNALQQAQQLLTETMNPARPIFTMGPTTSPDTSRTDADFDHMFRSEVMFSMYMLNRQNIYTTYFSPEIQQASRLSFNDYNENHDRLDALYDDGNDHRKKFGWIDLTNPNGTYLTHVKFSVAPHNVSPNMMPLIRLSEVILIAAECSNTLSEGTAYLNLLRTGRNCVDLKPATTDQLKDYITREFRKETIGEGQMFFYYKRNAMTAIPNHVWLNATPTKTMPLGSYVVPLPVSEVSVRGN